MIKMLSRNMSRRERKKTALKKTFETVVGNCWCYFKLMGGKFLNFFCWFANEADFCADMSK